MVRDGAMRLLTMRVWLDAGGKTTKDDLIPANRHCLILRSGRQAASRRMGRDKNVAYVRLLAAGFARGLAFSFRPRKNRGRRESRMRAAPAVSRARLCKKRTRAYRFSGSSPAFPAQWFTAYNALSPVTGLSCHRRRRKLVSVDLNASVGASGPHDFAVRFRRSRQ